MYKAIVFLLMTYFTLIIGLVFANAEAKKSRIETIIFKRITEPNEQAFTVLIPKGWQTEGGIIRIDPTAQGGPAQSIAAKIDFTIKRDGVGSAMLRRLPDILYFDSRKSIVGQMGLFPIGSNYNGMPVYPLMSALDYLKRLVFPAIHPQATSIKIIGERELPKLAQMFQQQAQAFQIPVDFRYDAGLLTVTYQEGSINYKEKLMAVIEDYGQMGAGIWGNKETGFFRAPVSEFDELEPIIGIIQSSIDLNSQWLSREILGQMQRSQIALDTQRYIQDLEKQIVENRQKINSEINNDMYLTLTQQEEYINPYTNKVEIGSNQWNYRWVNDVGDIIYSNNPNYKPNNDPSLDRQNFKLSVVRPR